MNIRLYNTRTRQKETFAPLRADEVTLYTCGPTVYDFVHIGNLRTFVFEDVLRRVLECNGFGVKHVMNITDVGHLTDDADRGEDKMEKGARREGKTAWEVASYYTDAFFEDTRALNVLPADVLPKASDHIREQIELIKRLEAGGYTYATSDGVYFDTSKFPKYGDLARLDVAGLQAGARVDMGEKKHSTDFALWKFSPAGAQRAMEWESPWGIGFPGWHIECSAMSMKYLGETIDIHTGGVDHVPVHHTNEIAQSEAATGVLFARMWMHGEFLLINEGRMGKSEGNFITLSTVRERGFDPLAYRYFTFGAHYRSKLNFTWESLQAAQRAYDKLVAKVSEWDEPAAGCAEFEHRFLESVNDDLNMPQALAVMWELVKSSAPSGAKAKSLFEMDRVLGLSLQERAQKLRTTVRAAGEDVRELLEERELARAQKDFATADRIRNEIQSHGLAIEDTDEGPILKLQ